MATLNLAKTEFADIAMIWLFDQVMNQEQVTNERLAEFIKENKSKLKSPLLAYYFDTETEMRRQYRRIGGVFDGSDNSIQQIRISPDKESKEKSKNKESKLKRLAKKVVKKVLAKEELNLEDVEILKEVVNVDNEIFNENFD